MRRADLNSIFIKSLGDTVDVSAIQDPNAKPLEVRLTAPVDHPSLLRAYLYTLTTHEKERQTGAYKIQVIVPGYGRDTRAYLDFSEDAFVILGGYEPDLDVFCFWDAGLYDARGIPYSRNLQVLDDTLYTALTKGVGVQSKALRGIQRGRSSIEHVVVVPRTRLLDGLQTRWNLTTRRLLGDG
jgi:hypothetical protein